MCFLPLVDNERVASRHREGDINSYENESDNDLPCVGSRCLEDMAALYPDRAREARRPPCPPSNGAPDRKYPCGGHQQRYALQGILAALVHQYHAQQKKAS